MSGGRMGRGPRMGAPTEKVKKETWGKLINYCSKHIAAVIIAVICAAFGTVLTLLGPDKLSEMTDIITEGIAPNSDKLEELTSAMTDNISANMETVMSAVVENISNPRDMETKMGEIMASPDIPDTDKQAFQEFLATASSGDNSQAAPLPLSISEALYDDIEVNGTTITVSEQLDLMNKISSIDPDDEQAAADAMSTLSDSVKNALYTDFTIDNVVISSEDQLEMMDLMGSMNTDDPEDMLSAMDDLPESVYGLIKPSIDIDKIVKIGITLIIFYAAGMALSSAQGWIMATVTQRISKKLRSDISVKINRLPMGYYHKTSTGDVLSRVTNDVDTIGMTLNMSIGMLVSSITLFVGSLVMMLKTNLIMTGTGIVATIIGFSLMMIIMGRSQKYFTRQQRHLGSLNGHIEEMYSGHTVVKAYNGEENAIKEFTTLNNKLRDSGFKAQALSGLMMPIMTFIGNFGYVAVCIVGAALALNGKITFGVIVSFMMYIRFFTQPLSQIAQAMQSLQQAGAASSRVFEFLEAEEMEDESGKEKRNLTANGNVTFSHVKFGYDPEKIIIKDFSAQVKAGQKIAIVGPTGAGKTTIVNLLMRFYEIDGGEIKIDGIPTSQMTREDVHSQFCMVLQDTWVFEGTVRENLIYCSENGSQEKMERACKAVGLDHFIRTLPNGYDTVLNDNVSLSQGQKQQLTIARAMIADKPILILDEATSSIDTRTEQKIQSAMDKLMENRTSFVIAHRLSTIKNSDLILVLKDGDVIESGNHDELMDQNGFYAELYNSQFDKAS